jgi:hypothetical protein
MQGATEHGLPQSVGRVPFRVGGDGTQQDSNISSHSTEPQAANGLLCDVPTSAQSDACFEVQVVVEVTLRAGSADGSHG